MNVQLVRNIAIVGGATAAGALWANSRTDRVDGAPSSASRWEAIHGSEALAGAVMLGCMSASLGSRGGALAAGAASIGLAGVAGALLAGVITT